MRTLTSRTHKIPLCFLSLATSMYSQVWFWVLASHSESQQLLMVCFFRLNWPQSNHQCLMRSFSSVRGHNHYYSPLLFLHALSTCQMAVQVDGAYIHVSWVQGLGFNSCFGWFCRRMGLWEPHIPQTCTWHWTLKSLVTSTYEKATPSIQGSSWGRSMTDYRA